MFNQLRTYFPQGCSLLIGLFFVLVLQIKASYTLIPLLIALIGFGFVYSALRSKQYQLDPSDKWIIWTVVFYFALFVLSVIIHDGRGRELDSPSRALLLLSVLAVCYKVALKPYWIIYGIAVGALLAGITASIRFFVLNQQSDLFPGYMYIQAGDIVMSLSLFSFAAAFYFQARKQTLWMLLCLIASVAAIFASLINQARGAWVAAPVALSVILFLNRKLLSKWVVIFLLLVATVGGLFAGEVIQKRWQQAKNEITHYVEHNNGSTSVGARFDMWKSALLGIQEKPLFGWGLEGVKEMRRQHLEQKLISEYAASFTHSHNQYLHDASVRGLLGLGALLAIFFVPLGLFWRNLKQSAVGSLAYLWGTLGITHVLATMTYCLTQAFFAHNSGTMFYFFVVILFLGLQKNAQKRALVGQ